jgi:uroporphyrinogen decarboxylase
MTSRERVRKALNHEEPDRVPVDWGHVNIINIHEEAYQALIDHLGIKHDYACGCVVQRLAFPSEEILNMFNVDTRALWCNGPSNWEYKTDKDGNFYDEFGTYYKRNRYYVDIAEPVLAKATSIEDYKRYKMPDASDPARFAGMRETARKMYEQTDFALVTGNLPLLHYTAWVLRGYEEYMYELAADKTMAYYLMDKILDWNLEFTEGYLKQIGDYIEIMWIGDDLGSQTGPFMNPEEFRKYTVPRFRELVAHMKRFTKAKVCMHTCGATMWAIDDLKDIGVDIVHPLQPSATGNDDPVRNKKAFMERKMTIHGGLDNQRVFHLSKDEVINEVKSKIKTYAPGGGYLFSCGHNIQANCPPENTLAIFDTLKKYGNYPIRMD